jgi:hypothetical protein
MIANSATSQMWEKNILKSSLWAQTIVLTSQPTYLLFPKTHPQTWNWDCKKSDPTSNFNQSIYLANQEQVLPCAIAFANLKYIEQKLLSQSHFLELLNKSLLIFIQNICNAPTKMLWLFCIN